MNEIVEFVCKRCGWCCRNLLETKDGIERGLPLTDKEATRFPQELVSPKVAIGITDPKIVVLYQLNVNVCPYINSQNVCEKYEDRPLMCRSFPIVAGDLSNRCTVFSYRIKGVSYSDSYSMEKQLDASVKFTLYLKNRIKKYYQKGLKVWEYNLATKNWVCRGFYDSL
ncbi:MAG: YkgJ family cysteine cluster protein [Candidatus Bathyarchaeota archaeon]|nr:YkgJ family cysteine cluster protein [Candidatus Bathyarchaeota archaeon]